MAKKAAESADQLVVDQLDTRIDKLEQCLKADVLTIHCPILAVQGLSI